MNRLAALDVFGLPIMLTYHNDTKYRSSFGLCMSLSFFIFMLLYFILGLYPELVLHPEFLHISVTSSSEKEKIGFRSGQGGLKLALGIQNSETGEYIMDTGLYGARARYLYRDSETNHTIPFNLEIQPCEDDYFNLANLRLPNEVKISQLYCLSSFQPAIPKKFKSIPIIGRSDSKVFGTLQISLVRCDDKKATCWSNEKTDQLLNSATVAVYYNDFRLQLDQPKSAFKPTLTGLFTSIDSEFTQKQAILMKNVTVVTDRGIFFSQSQTSQVFMTDQQIQSVTSNKEGKLFDLLFSMSTIQEMHTRKYKKIFYFVAQLGGYIKAFMLFGVLYRPFLKKKYYMDLINHLYRVDGEEAIRKESILQDLMVGSDELPLDHSDNFDENGGDESGQGFNTLKKRSRRMLLWKKFNFFKLRNRRKQREKMLEQNLTKPSTDFSIISINQHQGTNRDDHNDNNESSMNLDSRFEAQGKNQIEKDPKLDQTDDELQTGKFRKLGTLAQQDEDKDSDTTEEKEIDDAEYEEMWYHILDDLEEENDIDILEFGLSDWLGVLVPFLRTGKHKLLQKGARMIDSNSDISFLMRKIQEFEMFKKLILDKEQEKLFTSLPKPNLSNINAPKPETQQIMGDKNEFDLSSVTSSEESLSEELEFDDSDEEDQTTESSSSKHYTLKKIVRRLTELKKKEFQLSSDPKQRNSVGSVNIGQKKEDVEKDSKPKQSINEIYRKLKDRQKSAQSDLITKKLIQAFEEGVLLARKASITSKLKKKKNRTGSDVLDRNSSVFNKRNRPGSMDDSLGHASQYSGAKHPYITQETPNFALDVFNEQKGGFEMSEKKDDSDDNGFA